MVAYPAQPPRDPGLARLYAEQMKTRLKLDFSRLPGSFVSKHRGGEDVAITRAIGFYGFTALIFKTPLNEDLDGAPNSFAPPISLANLDPQGGLQPVDHIANATNGKTGTDRHIFHADSADNKYLWTGVKSAAAAGAAQRIDQREFLKDSLGRFPLFRPAGDAFADFYAPQTAMNAADGQAVNPLEVPYAALSHELKTKGGVELGDVGLAIRVSTGASTGFIYADAGGENSTSVGECSRKMIRNLFGGAASDEDVCYIVFPNTSLGAVARPDRIPQILQAKLQDFALFDFTSTDELIDRCANPQFGERLSIGRRFLAPVGFRAPLQVALRDWDSIARASVRMALRRAGAPV